jgi:1,4-alpha-glucan branching enzyme
MDDGSSFTWTFIGNRLSSHSLRMTLRGSGKTKPAGSALFIAPRDPEEPWWKSSVVYQVYVRSFADSNGDGIGDLEGLRRRLDYIADLGVGAIWVTPIYRSPHDDNGYDISDYQQIDPVYGSLEDFDALLSAVHEGRWRPSSRS